MVEINEILPNPTVKQVAFEVRFPNLFFIEDKIGDLQLKVMELFPESAVVMRKKILFADVGEDGKIVNPPPDMDKEFIKKIWQFKSEKDFELNVSTDSLSIISNHHVTYMKDGEDKFRDVIKFVVDSFLEIANIPRFNRIGLRYIDEAPIPVKENLKFIEWYNTAFPTSRFEIADATEMVFHTVVKKEEYFLRYVEKLLKKEEEKYALILDFDGYATKIETSEYLSVTDNLYQLIKAEFENTIKEPVLDFMKQPKEA